MTRFTAHGIACSLILCLLANYFLNRQVGGDSGDYPARPIRLVVPFNPGGGSDTFARIMKTGIDEAGLLPQPLIIINRPGGSATIGSRYVRDAKPDGYTMLFLHNAMISAKYSGKVSYGPEAFEPIAGTSEMGMVIAVRDDAPWHNLAELMDETRERPDKIVHGVNFGAPTHFAGLGLERAVPGAKFRYTQAGDGADRSQKIVGGHIQVAGFSASEYVTYQPQGIRALAFLGREPHPAFPDVPTARQQGIDVLDINMQYWWFPKGTEQEKIDYIADVLEKAMQTEHVRQKLDELKLEPKYLRGDELKANLDERIAAVSAVGQQERPDVPDFPVYVLAAIILCGLAIGTSTLRRGDTTSPPGGWNLSPRFRQVAILGVVITAYVAVMQFELVSFPWATAVFILATGFVLTAGDRRQIPVLAETALIVAFGTHWLLTSVVITDLP